MHCRRLYNAVLLMQYSDWIVMSFCTSRKLLSRNQMHNRNNLRMRPSLALLQLTKMMLIMGDKECEDAPIKAAEGTAGRRLSASGGDASGPFGFGKGRQSADTSFCMAVCTSYRNLDKVACAVRC